MNHLITDPPEELEVEGITYPIDAHYRNGLVIMEAFGDQRLRDYEKRRIMLRRLFGRDNIPPNTDKAAEACVWFLDCGEDWRPAKEGRLYSFSHDSKFIKTAVEKSHQLKLREVGFLHWWDFVHLFFDLDEGCFFNQLVALRRRMKNPKDLTKEDKRYIKENPDIVNLPALSSPIENGIVMDEFEARYRAALLRRNGGG